MDRRSGIRPASGNGLYRFGASSKGAWLVSITLCLGCAGLSQPGTARVHLVVDVGSSGTSLCLFQVEPQPVCRIAKTPPVCVRAKGGLADLVLGKTAHETAALLQDKLADSLDRLGKPDKNGKTDWRKHLHGAAALGTGGFRDPETGEQVQRPEWTALWPALRSLMQQKTQLSHAVARPLTGQEEGLLAWHGVRVSVNPETPFATMEVGGATVQLAVSDTADEKAVVVAVSDSIGQDRTFERFARETPRPEFSACYSPHDRQKQDGHACIEFLYDQVFSTSRVAGLAAVSSPRRVYALGQPWLGLLRELPTSPPWLAKKNRELPTQVRLSDLVALADSVCKESDAQILARAPHSYEAKRGAGRTCYSVGYHAAYLQAISRVVQDGRVVPGGDEQWARGAAVSGAFFPQCAASADHVPPKNP